MDILERFHMQACKPLDTPMASNLKITRDEDVDLVDPSLYMQLIGSFMFLMNTKARHFLCYEETKSVYGFSTGDTLGGYKACSQVSKGNFSL
jgi:hypothetical protein